MVWEVHEAQGSDLVEVTAEGRTSGAWGAHTCLLPVRTRSSLVFQQHQRTEDVQAPSIAQEVAEDNHCYGLPSRQSLGSSREGAITRRRKSSCVQPVLHQGLKLCFFGQLLSPSCTTTEMFLAIQGPERLCTEPAVARRGQPIHSSECSRGKDSKSLTAPAVLFQ